MSPYRSKATSARQSYLPLSRAPLRTQERLVDCTQLIPLNAMAADATHAVTTNGDMVSRPGRAYVETLRNLSQELGGGCTPSLWQSTLCWRVAKCTRFASGCTLSTIYTQGPAALEAISCNNLQRCTAKVLSRAWKFLGLVDLPVRYVKQYVAYAGV